MERIRNIVAQVNSFHADLSDVEPPLQKAEEAMRLEDLKGAESLIERAEVTSKAKVEGLLKDRYPRLFLETTNAGLQANRWNRFEMNITNKGNWPAEHVTPIVSGPVEVVGLRTVEKIEPNQKVSLEFGLKPKEAGTMDFDFEVHYTRPLDDGKHQTTDTAVVRVEPETGYLIDDGLLFHSTGALVCHETRTYVPPEEASRAAALEAKVKEFVNRAFPNGGKSIQTASFGGTTVLPARGPPAFLAVTLRGKDPAILPLYVMQVLKDIHDAYGPRLEEWSGDPAELPGIRDAVRKILFATDVEGVSLGPLEDSPVSKIPMLMERGLLAGEGQADFLTWARMTIEREGYGQGIYVQIGAKELDLVAPNDMWSGMKSDVQVHMDSVSAAYKLWARKIEILLRSQDAWKIKAGLDRGEYAVGIEGQRVRIDPSMVSFVESIPEYVVEEPFEGGVVYLDTRMSKELIAEGYAKEIANLVREARKDMRLADDRIVEIELVAGKPFRAMLQPWKDMILRDSNALDLQFVTEPDAHAYVIEAELGGQTC